jgi:DNA-binding LytR/AlgR family response regulator
MMIKTFIAEDEEPSLNRLKRLLEEYPNLQLVGTALNGIAAIEEVNKLRPDLLLLDIKMPGKNGFEVLEELEYVPLVIFITAYNQYAIKAFEENAVDYLLKPVSPKRLTSSINRVLERKIPMDINLFNDLFKKGYRPDYIRRFTVKRGDEILIIPEEQVYYFKAEEGYIFLHTYSNHFFFEMTLRDLEKNLNPSKFCRIHKSYIVALDQILKIKKWFKGEVMVEMKDEQGSILKVSRNFKPLLLKRLPK